MYGVYVSASGVVGGGVIIPIAGCCGVVPELACTTSLGCLVFHGSCLPAPYSHGVGCDPRLLVLLFAPLWNAVPRASPLVYSGSRDASTHDRPPGVACCCCCCTPWAPFCSASITFSFSSLVRLLGVPVAFLPPRPHCTGRWSPSPVPVTPWVMVPREARLPLPLLLPVASWGAGSPGSLVGDEQPGQTAC